MTTSENVGKAYMLSVVEQRIRKDIPRLMELREGCLVKKDKDIFRIHEDYKRDGYNIGRYFYLYEDSIEKEYEIIGHDIMLNDLLEWLNYKFYTKDYFITSKGVFGYRTVEYNTIETYILSNIKIELKTPYLKDQSEELIKFLYELEIG